MLLYPVTDVLGVRFCAGGQTIESGACMCVAVASKFRRFGTVQLTNSHSPPDFSLTKILEYTSSP